MAGTLNKWQKKNKNKPKPFTVIASLRHNLIQGQEENNSSHQEKNFHLPADWPEIVFTGIKVSPFTARNQGQTPEKFKLNCR